MGGVTTVTRTPLAMGGQLSAEALHAPAPQATPTALMAGDRLTLTTSTPGLFNLPGLSAGQQFSVNGRYGFWVTNFKGTAQVETYNAKELSILITINEADVRLAGHKDDVGKAVRLRFQLQDDGTVRFAGDQVGGEAIKDAPTNAGDILTVESNKPGRTVLKPSDSDNTVTVASETGKLSIEFSGKRIVLSR